MDDSANKRISVPEAFLAVDGILNLYNNVADGLVVYPKVIEQHMLRELPFMATENIMMDAVKRGGNRQELHERIRIHSMEAAKVVKEQGGENDLLARIAGDPMFGVTLEELHDIVKPEKYVGRAPAQTTEFLTEVVAPGAGEVQRRGRGKGGNHRVSIGRHRGHSPQQKQKGMKCYG